MFKGGYENGNKRTYEPCRSYTAGTDGYMGGDPTDL